MTLSTSQVYPQKPTTGLSRFVTADGASPYKTLVAGGTDGALVNSIIAYVDGSTSYPLWIVISNNVLVKINSMATSTAIDVLALIPGLPKDAYGNPYIILGAGVDLVAKIPSVTVTSGEAVEVTSFSFAF
jgi:hypothetical protein